MNLFDLAAKISLDTSGYEAGVRSAKGTMQGVVSTFSGAVGAIENFGAKVIDIGEEIIAIGDKAKKAFVAVETAIGTAVGTLIKTSVEGYGEFEQLVGGVETLFGAGGKSIEEYAESVGKSVDEVKEEYDRLIQSQDEVIQNAAGAFKTAGLSAVDYMQTVTSFSASLLQGLGGDTAKAAEYADLAITDMADNANKMGSDIGAIQYAYQGFAKQNYTMLDNLKIGFGGSASEMARLINESGVLGDAIEVTAKTVKDVPFDKVIEAIHVIQTNLGITGTTAKEAASTIQGSVASAKTAFTNFAVGLADGTQDIDLLFDNLIESVGIAADNIAPRIISAIDRISDTVEKRSDQIADFIGGIASKAAEQVPKFLDITTSILQNVIKEVGENEDEIKEAGISLFEQILTAFEETVDLALPIAEGLLPTIISEFLRYEGTLFQTGVKIIMSFIRGVSNQSDELADSAFSALETMLTTVDENLDEFLAAGEKIIDSLIDALDENSGSLQGTSESIIMKIVNFAVGKLPDVVDFGLDVIESVLTGIDNNAENLVDGATDIIKTLTEKLTDHERLRKIIGVGLSIIKNLMTGITNNSFVLSGSATDIMESLVDGLTDNLPELIPVAMSMIGKLLETATNPENQRRIWEASLELIIELANGLVDSIPELLESVPTIIGNLVENFGMQAGELTKAALQIIWDLVTGLTSEESTTALSGATGKIIGTLIKIPAEKLGDLIEMGKKIINKIKEGFESLFDNKTGDSPKDWGEELLEKITGGILSKLSQFKNTLKSAWNGLTSIFKDEDEEEYTTVYEYENDKPKTNYSPSTGYIANIGTFADALAFTQSGGYVSSGNGAGGGTITAPPITNNITVNGAEVEDADELAEKIANRIGKQLGRKTAGGFTYEQIYE